MRRSSAMLLLVSLLLAAGCSSAPATPKPATSTPPATSASATDPVNPTVTPPKGEIKVAPDLVVTNAPSDGGYLSAQDAQAKAIALMAKSHEYGVLTLSSLQFDLANKTWEAKFTTDGRLAAAPRSHPAEFTSNDPVEQRRQAHSWTSIASTINIALDGTTGEPRGGGFSSAKAEPTRSDLEHYRGVILEGGEVVKLRLTKPDGSREGRDIEVSLPQDVLAAANLPLWQVQYGAGRQLEVWGLSGRPNVVVAYKVALKSPPPPESLLAAGLMYGVPLYPGAYIKDGAMVIKNGDLKGIQEWYATQLPLYGFQPAGPEGDFENAAWDHIRLSFATQDGAVAMTVTRP